MINERANNKFLQNGVYKKNNKALGQTLHITRKSTSKNIHSNNTNPLQKNTFEQNKYLKKSVNKKLSNDIQAKKIYLNHIYPKNEYIIIKQSLSLSKKYIKSKIILIIYTYQFPFVENIILYNIRKNFFIIVTFFIFYLSCFCWIFFCFFIYYLICNNILIVFFIL